ncbi:hypothetical protein [Vibrio diabolicus]|uniref:hypothetical protein n=1 Tax=Vibrio diabolicus TaxID=50719 RepID=UPI00375235A0
MVCLSQNSGFSKSCPKAHQIQSQQDESVNLSPSCDLSEKLVQAYQHQLDHIPFFLFALIVALPMASTAIHYLEYTEPIPEKCRVHLKLCVFRE